MMLKTTFSFLTASALIITSWSCEKTAQSQNTPPPPPPPATFSWEFESTPLWEENFDYSGPPSDQKWSFETGGHGWGNNELQFYTPAGNASVDNGVLSITAKRESFSGKEYTSARLITRGKAEWLYGRVEVRAKLPKGKGTWPAIWMLPSENAYGGWPNSGEIDLMEHVGYDPNRVHFTIHTKAFNHLQGTQKGANKIISDAMDNFHIYRVDWTPYGLRGYFDGELVFTFLNQGAGPDYWPFDKKFFLILNVAVGGNWAGQQGIDNTAFPTSMLVDYVKVYKFVK